jgi:DinB superfamily
MNGTLKRLDTIHGKLSTAIRATDPNLFFKRPGEDEWSIAEVVQHLCLVEEQVLLGLQKGLKTEAARVGFFKKLIPMRIVSLRLTKVRAPKLVTPNNPPAMDELLKTYDAARADLKQFCTNHGRARLKAMSLKHPVFGNIDGVAAVSMVGFHEERHYKQIREILKKLGASN